MDRSKNPVLRLIPEPRRVLTVTDVCINIKSQFPGFNLLMIKRLWSVGGLQQNPDPEQDVQVTPDKSSSLT